MQVVKLSAAKVTAENKLGKNSKQIEAATQELSEQVNVISQLKEDRAAILDNIANLEAKIFTAQQSVELEASQSPPTSFTPPAAWQTMNEALGFLNGAHMNLSADQQDLCSNF